MVVSPYLLILVPFNHIVLAEAGITNRQDNNITWKDIVEISSWIATTITVIVVYKQSRQTQQQMDSTLRPWIGTQTPKMKPMRLFQVLR